MTKTCSHIDKKTKQSCSKPVIGKKKLCEYHDSQTVKAKMASVAKCIWENKEPIISFGGLILSGIMIIFSKGKIKPKPKA